MIENPHRCIVDSDNLYVDFVRTTDIYGNPLDEPDGRPLKHGERLVEKDPPPIGPGGLVKARLVGDEWEESATPEEIENAKKEWPQTSEPSNTPSMEQRLQAAEDAIMALALGGMQSV